MSRLAVGLLAVVLLSGCFVEKDPEAVVNDAAGADDSTPATTGEAKPGSTKPAGSTSAAGAAGSAPMLADLVLNATGLEALFSFTADDADNDTVTWAMDFGDNTTANGTLGRTAEMDESLRPTGNHSLAGSSTHAYAAAGDYVATLTLSDGKSSVNRTLNVTLADAAPSGPPMDPIAISGSCTTRAAETSTHLFTVTPGQALIHATIAIGGGGVDLDWSLIDPSGSQADVAESFTPRGEDALDAEAPVAGDWTIQVTCFLGVAASYDIDVTFA